MFAFSLLAAAAFAFADPVGDAHGDGHYILPTRPATNADALDLREFKAEELGRRMRFTIGFGALSNPWNLSSGFSAGVTDIFVRSGLGGEQALGNLNLTAAGSSGWEYHLHISGAESTLTRFTGGGTPPALLAAPQVHLQGSNLIVDSDLPAGQYSYWVTSSVYSPLSADGLLKPSAQASATGLQTPRANAPIPVDVLAAADDNAAYTSGELAAVGQTKDWRPWWLVLLGGSGLLLTLLSTWQLWHRP